LAISQRGGCGSLFVGLDESEFAIEVQDLQCDVLF
jgi:hypothetical protein